ncbi:DoxX family protein [Chryseobacterium cucumeris]|uniref:DoxX family protein n=1 Tax=Chryseobacterium cucumeris TaxID=1813611 RepID=UPI000ADD42B2|nr:DoxX family protein [Chryseobacterium cucumeris]
MITTKQNFYTDFKVVDIQNIESLFLYSNFVSVKKSFYLRFALSVILLMHSVISIFSGDVNDFGQIYLNGLGFNPVGIYIAWIVKLIHLLSVPLIWIDRYIKPIAVCNILIFILGIYYVHWQNGWFVVGGGTNGIEFNVLLIFCFLNLMYPKVSLHFMSKKKI